MTKITKSVEFDYGHRIPCHKSKCRNLHGHRGVVEVTLGGPIIDKPLDSSEGMVVDFSDVKDILVTHIHDVLDHSMVWYEKDYILAKMYTSDLGRDMRNVKVPFVPTAENLVKWCYDQIKDKFKKDITVMSVRFYETPNSYAVYEP